MLTVEVKVLGEKILAPSKGNYIYFKPSNKTGKPDLVFIWKGKIVGIRIKRVKEKPEDTIALGENEYYQALHHPPIVKDLLFKDLLSLQIFTVCFEHLKCEKRGTYSSVHNEDSNKEERDEKQGTERRERT